MEIEKLFSFELDLNICAILMEVTVVAVCEYIGKSYITKS